MILDRLWSRAFRPDWTRSTATPRSRSRPARTRGRAWTGGQEDRPSSPTQSGDTALMECTFLRSSASICLVVFSLKPSLFEPMVAVGTPYPVDDPFLGLHQIAQDDLHQQNPAPSRRPWASAIWVRICQVRERLDQAADLRRPPGCEDLRF